MILAVVIEWIERRGEALPWLAESMRTGLSFSWHMNAGSDFVFVDLSLVHAVKWSRGLPLADASTSATTFIARGETQ